MVSRKKGEVPLERALSKLGLFSRTEARRRIEAGEISVDGYVVRDPLYPVRPEGLRVSHSGVPLSRPPFRCLLLHKPRGVVTTRADERGRPTVFSLHPGDFDGLHAVGRLDLATSGLLILTNSTRFSAWLTDPATRIPRVYAVTVEGRAGADTLSALRAGVEDGGDFLKAERAELRKESGRESHLTITLLEGKNREVRRLLERVGHPVTRLKRVAFGGLSLEALAPGEFKTLTPAELKRVFPGAPGLAR